MKINVMMIRGNNHLWIQILCHFLALVMFWNWENQKKIWNFKILKSLSIFCLYVTEYCKKVFKQRCVCTFLKKLCNLPHLESHVSNWHFCLEMWLHWPGHHFQEWPLQENKLFSSVCSWKANPRGSTLGAHRQDHHCIKNAVSPFTLKNQFSNSKQESEDQHIPSPILLFLNGIIIKLVYLFV